MKFAILRRRTWKNLSEIVKLSSIFGVSKETLFIIVFFIHRILFILPAKYEYKRFFDKSALVASKLGPPRSSSLAQQPPSASLPQPAPVPRSSAHTTKPYVAASTTSTSSYTAPAAPPKPPRTLPTAQPPQPSGGVWDDINSLKGNGQNSSLPLQYQEHTYSQGNHSMQLPAVNGTMGANNYYVGGTPPVIGLNSYQPNQVRTNPFSQQSSKPSLVPSSMTSNYSATQTMNSQPFGQQSYSVSQSSASLPVTPAYYEPQSQTSMQIQNPSGQAFISGPPSHLFPGPSAPPIGQSQFMPQSHDSIPQQHYTHSPHLMQSPSIPQGIYPPGPAPSQMGGHSVSGQHGQFSGLTTMQMQQMQMQQQQQQQMQQRQQQQIQIQQQQMPMQQQQQQQQMQQHQSQQLGQNYYSASMQPQMMSHQVNNAYNQTSTYPQGGFPPQTGGQW